MESISGNFTVQSTFEMMRHKREMEEWRNNMWCKGVSFKFSFLLWRSWKGRIATEDNLRRMRVNVASRFYCYESFDEETMTHFF